MCPFNSWGLHLCFQNKHKYVMLNEVLTRNSRMAYFLDYVGIKLKILDLILDHFLDKSR